MDSRNLDRRVRPERLLARSQTRMGQPLSIGARAAETLTNGLLERLSVGHLKVIDHTRGTTSEYGPDRHAPDVSAHGTGPDDAAGRPHRYRATVEIHDARAWTAVLTEGSIGFGRGYIEQWWSSPDPTELVRLVIANLTPLDDVRNRIGRYTRPLTDGIRRLLPSRSRTENRDEIASHYDLGNDFFRLFLDETMTYSSAVFAHPSASLAEASRHKYDLVIDSLDLGPDDHLLEIGTGWGGLALRAVERTGCRVTTTTISAEQYQLARERIREAGCQDRIEVLDIDWRDVSGQYDRVASIEMIEAVDWRQYRRFFSTIERCLRPDGRAVLQAICVPDRRYERTKNTEDFIRRFIFPGGFLPSIGSMIDAVAAATRMQVVGVNDFSAHYAETLRRWRIRFDERVDDIRSLGLDDRFVRLWRFYLAYCEAGFLERHCTVNHIALVGRQWRSGIDRAPSAIV
ncbi:MAG: cyclopropane-fatty-acyl-phospholipid synthase family protein [Acidimicrobiia bacterium]|nr:cyclopropane-fatty-acyl-phospholipid synthase family protein [Acidimicrobiia bacterium]